MALDVSRTGDDPLRVVAFDLDGLMFNTEEIYTDVGGQLLARRGKSVTRELLDQMMGRPSPVALQIMIDWHDLDATVPELEQESQVLFEDLLETRLEPLPGLLALLSALESAGVPKAIATSSRRVLVDRILGLQAMHARFDFILTCEDIVHGKPDPEIYRKVANQFGVPSKQMLVLEDSENGCRSGVAAGAFVVAVPGPHTSRHQYPGAAIIADTLQDRRIYHALGLPPVA